MKAQIELIERLLNYINTNAPAPVTPESGDPVYDAQLWLNSNPLVRFVKAVDDPLVDASSFKFSYTSSSVIGEEWASVSFDGGRVNLSDTVAIDAILNDAKVSGRKKAEARRSELLNELDELNELLDR